ncbi:SDR family oxidoreductase [Nakamurella lactea]|uniref:SDR family oxidoreductase n=1 Tax=Nakamurella lactea TaxID=459515 RepID=UPI00048BEAEF|nr:SDR family oxidoreductase [Nakamurella lactea]
MTTPELAGQVAIVTGGTKGIGAAITRRLLAAGAEVVICGRTAPAQPIRTADAGDLPDREAVFIAADVRDPEQGAALVAATVQRFGRLDLLVNNAGGAPNADSATVSPRFIAKIVELNLLAPFYVAQQANAVMQQQESGGLIINIGSVAGRDPAPDTAAYAAAKAGLTMLTKALGMDFGPKVRVNQVTVGLVRTDLSHLYYGDEAGQDRVAKTIPLQRMATPNDIADACLLLAGPLAGYVTGTDLLVDGGGEIPARHLAVTPPSTP